MSNTEIINKKEETSRKVSAGSSSKKMPSRKKEGSILIIGAIVVVVVVVIAAIFFSGVLNGGSNDYKATIYVHVTSVHIANVVNVELFADGKSIESYSLEALDTQVYQYDAWLSGSSNDIVISGTGEGGGLGDTSDSETISVSDGETYNVYLTL
jgi:uncharacterized protein YpmB